MSERESVVQRIDRLIAAAIARGEHRSAAQVLIAAGLSSGWLSELRQRVERDPGATITAATASALAAALRVGAAEIYGEEPPPPDNDVFPERSWAVLSARILHYSEAAIGRVRAEPGQTDWTRLYWFRRIETETERLPPAAGAPGEQRQLPGGGERGE